MGLERHDRCEGGDGTVSTISIAGMHTSPAHTSAPGRTSANVQSEGVKNVRPEHRIHQHRTWTLSTYRWKDLFFICLFLTYTHVFKGGAKQTFVCSRGVIEVDRYAITLQCAQTT
jgi:hypothetical protein